MAANCPSFNLNLRLFKEITNYELRIKNYEESF